METFKTLIWIVNIFSALAIVFLVLMQQGKGADAGAAFGTGSAQGVFGAAGSANFLSRSTAVAAAVFFATCLMLAYASAHQHKGLDFGDVVEKTAPTVPVEQKTGVPEPKIPD